ncbi:MAG: type II secretion system F family protein [Planctomycetota bacterium]
MIDALKLLVDAVFWLIAGTVMWVVLGLAVLAVFGPLPGVLMLMIGFMGLAMLTLAVRHARSASTLLTMGYVRHAVSQNLPVVPILEAIERGRVSRWRQVRSARRAIEQGRSVASGLSEVRMLPRWAHRTVAAGEATGRLSDALTRATARMRARMTAQQGDPLILGGAYASILVSLLLGALAFFAVFILPQYREIAEDFGIELPWQTVLTFTFFTRFQWPLVAGAYLMIAGLGGVTLWSLIRGVPPVPGMGWLVEQWCWRVPPWRGQARERSYAEAAWLLGDGLRAGLPMHVAIRAAAAGGVNSGLRSRLTRWASRVEAGESAGASARGCGVRAELGAMVETASRSTDPSGPLDFVARLYELRSEGRDGMVRAVVLPMITLGLSFVVGWVVYSLMLPLPMLMEATLPEWSKL